MNSVKSVASKKILSYTCAVLAFLSPMLLSAQVSIANVRNKNLKAQSPQPRNQNQMSQYGTNEKAALKAQALSKKTSINQISKEKISKEQISSEQVPAMGTKDGGGGHWFESNFKAKADSILNQLQAMSQEAKNLLSPKLDLELLAANLEVPNRFQPLCAEQGQQLKFLKQKQRMAYVGAPNTAPNVILLDCSEELRKDWESKFESSKPGDLIFFLHEMVRNDDIRNEEENSYQTSSTILKAIRIEDEANNQLILKLIENSENGVMGSRDHIVCSIGLESSAMYYKGMQENHYWARLYISKGNGTPDLIHQDRIVGSMKKPDFIQNLLFSKDDRYLELRTKLLRMAKVYRCAN